MGTRVFTNNSRAPHHSSNIPQATPSAKLSTSGAQPQNTFDSRLTIDDTVDRILVKAKSPLKEGEVRLLVEALEKVSNKYLLPTARCIQPADDRYWSPDTP